MNCTGCGKPAGFAKTYCSDCMHAFHHRLDAPQSAQAVVAQPTVVAAAPGEDYGLRLAGQLQGGATILVLLSIVAGMGVWLASGSVGMQPGLAAAVSLGVAGNGFVWAALLQGVGQILENSAATRSLLEGSSV